jgi:hypothetical protein
MRDTDLSAVKAIPLDVIKEDTIVPKPVFDEPKVCCAAQSIPYHVSFC